MHSKFGIFARLCKISSCRRVFQLCLGQGVFWEVMMLLINIISPPPCVFLMTILLEVLRVLEPGSFNGCLQVLGHFKFSKATNQ